MAPKASIPTTTVANTPYMLDSALLSLPAELELEPPVAEGPADPPLVVEPPAAWVAVAEAVVDRPAGVGRSV